MLVIAQCLSIQNILFLYRDALKCVLRHCSHTIIKVSSTTSSNEIAVKGIASSLFDRTDKTVEDGHLLIL